MTSVKEAFRLQPGITLGTGEGGNAFGDRIFVRGYDARNDVYIDGLRDPGVVSRETFAVERIEVLHGPSSTLGGRGTTGGAVRIVTKMPASESFVSPDVSLGSGNTVRATVDANGTVGEHVRVRVNALGHRADEVPGRDAVADDRRGGAVAATFSPFERTTFTVDHYGLKTDGIPDWGHPYDSGGNRPYPVDRDNFYGVVDRDFHETSARTTTAYVEHEFSDALRLDVQFRRGVTTNSYIVSAPGFSTRSCPGLDPSRQVCASAKTRDQENDFTGGQANLVGTFGPNRARHTLVAGLESSAEAVDVRRPSVQPRGVIHDLAAPNPRLAGPGRSCRRHRHSGPRWTPQPSTYSTPCASATGGASRPACAAMRTRSPRYPAPRTTRHGRSSPQWTAISPTGMPALCSSRAPPAACTPP